MKKVILKDAGKLKDLIDGLIEEAIPMNLDKKLFREALDQAFAEEEEKPWEPKEGEMVWYLRPDGGTVKIRYSAILWLLELENGFIHPTEESAQQFLEDYKTFLSERIKNR